MSNVDQLKRSFEVFNETRALDPELVTADVEWRALGDAPDGGARGSAEVEQWLRELREVIPDVRIEVEEYVDRGDVVVTVGRLHGCGKGSGGEVALPLTNVWQFRDGRVACVESYATKEEAFDAAGLS